MGEARAGRDLAWAQFTGHALRCQLWVSAQARKGLEAVSRVLRS